jgi:hypothetical protein
MTDITSGGARFAGQTGPSASQGGAPFSAPGYAAPRSDAVGYAPGQDYAQPGQDYAQPGQDYAQPGKTPEQLAYERGQRDATRRLTTPRMTGWRVVCGICWALWTLLLGVGAFVSLFQGNIGSFLLAAVLASLAGWYDYRIWTLKARRLTLFIIF